jgi:phosphatidylserine/phosphatidylglycerophosphate/cardiolipin synthase-like enzyme
LSSNTAKFDGYGNQSKPRTMFGENTFGNCVTFTIDGQENFRLMYEKMLQAKSSIYIANYDLDPELRLIRGRADPQFLQISHFIVSPCLSESNNGNNKNNDSYEKNPHNDEYHILQNLLIEKAKQKVDIKIIVWEPRLVVRAFPLAKKRGLEGRRKKVESLRELAKHYGVEEHMTVRLDSNAPTFTSGFHEKIAIIDNQIGFCGGQDLSQDKWDTSDHDFDNSLRDQDGQPWHDVNAMIKGPIIWDLIFHFNQRWIYSLTKDIKQVKKAKINSSGSFFSSSISPSAASITNRGNEGNIEISALRTWKQLKGNIGDGDDDSNGGGSSVRTWYDTMFRKAKHSIYIEDQFLFQDKIVAQLLAKRLEEEQDLKVITVGPMEPNLPGFIFSVLSKESINDINNNLAALRKAGKNRVRTYCLISQHSTIKQKRKQIYVHSKIMIVDDRLITIGSANTDRDGFKDSTEFDLAMTSTTLAQQLRAKLWREHLKDYIYSSSNDINLNDFNKGFEVWEKVANDNGKRVQKGEAIQGHIYYYNFEEMNFPPPYLGAKGGNKFRLF